MKRLLALLMAGLCLVAASGADEASKEKEDPRHDEIRKVRDGLIDAVNKNDRDKLLSYLHKNVTVTWLNGEVSRGPDEVKAYYDRMMTGDKKVVQRITIKPEVERLSDLYGDSAVAYGHSDDHFELTSGLNFDVRSRWSATLVKEDGRWKIVSFHASTGLFDNPLLNAAKQTAYWAGGIAAVVGLVAGFVLGKLLRKRA